ncbi:DUF222 domain-containing protein [Phytoactinopolyspora alkaliphila]|uniref:DUF222 domain-containing protein n=1 Tax=Phytoactinopolyspora alkaliphila TaxID=1783498 RepID=A0A6N9YMP2_9ACTN|nr:DUF222 domain-containing protein [Phytoactinopolyspora alkaliphila]NED96128.1 DUF222 domain-containing protein [Phytoactinopolyspora alkaliphila]
MSADGGLPVDVAAMLPGPELLEVLTGVEVAGLSARDTVVVAAAWERQAGYAAAQQAKALAALAAKPEYRACDVPPDVLSSHQHDPLAPVSDEVSLALRLTGFQARARVKTACELIEVFPATLDALEAGLIDAYKATLICERTRVLDNAAARRGVQTRVLPIAATRTARQLDDALRRAVIAADPDAAEQRRTRAAKHRRVDPPQPATDAGADGIARLALEGPAEDIVALWTAIDAAARHARTQDDERTLAQLRFDILCGLGWTGLDLGHLGCCNPACATAHPFGHTHGRAATVHVTVPATALLGNHSSSNDGSGPGTGEDGVAYLHGYGPVTAHAARRVATEATLRRLLTDHTHGQVLEYGRSTYTPPQELADYVIARDVTCRFPTCHQPARHGDIDHKHPLGNRRHHRRLQHLVPTQRPPPRQNPPSLHHPHRPSRHHLVDHPRRSPLPGHPRHRHPHPTATTPQTSRSRSPHD